MNPEMPSCAEDELISPLPVGWKCGPAIDDYPLTVVGTGPLTGAGGACDAIMGTGDYAHGNWSGYTCVTLDFGDMATESVVPDTSFSPISGGIGEGLGVLLLIIAMLLVSWRKDRA